MSVPDPSPPRKFRRFGLYAPFAVAVVVIAAWSGLWFWLRSETVRRLDAAVAYLRQAGYEASWDSRAVGGYPFRLNVDLTGLRIREPTGWALQAPRLEAQSYVHAPTYWLFAAPQGLTFVRPEGGPVQVGGRIVRASLSHLDDRPPSFSFQGLELTFSPQTGARPFGLQAAKKIEFHLRAGPDDEGGVFASVEGGRAQPASLLGHIAGQGPVTLTWNSTLSRMSAFKGRDWPGAVRHWVDAGGAMTVREARVSAGEATLTNRGGALSVGSDGRLRGMLEVSLGQAPRALAAMAATGALPADQAGAAAMVAAARQGADQIANATIAFQAGQATLGPVAIGPAPRVYQAR